MYFPMFEEQLAKYDLPLEFKYLAVVESALKPTAKSRAGATGLWQFMYRTGKSITLKQIHIMMIVKTLIKQLKRLVSISNFCTDYMETGNWY